MLRHTLTFLFAYSQILLATVVSPVQWVEDFGPTMDQQYYIFEGSAIVANEAVQLSPDAVNQAGRLMCSQAYDLTRFSLSFSFKIEGAPANGDGIVCFWHPSQTPPMSYGASMGWGPDSTGVGIKIDTYENAWDNGPYRIALIRNGVTDIISDFDFPAMVDGNWHTLGITKVSDIIAVEVDGNQVISSPVIHTFDGGYFFLSAGTGTYSDNHWIDNIFLQVDQDPCQQTDLPFIDNFDSPELDSCWSWVREDTSRWSLTERPGWMRIYTTQGNVEGVHNVLLRAKPIGNFEFETRVNITPTHDYHGAGLICYQDDNNWFYIARQKSDAQKVQVLGRDGGAVSGNEFDSVDASFVYLRIRVESGLLTAMWSLDHRQWSSMITRSYSWSGGNGWQIGLLSLSGGNNAPEIPADFEYLKADVSIDTVVCGNVSGVWDSTASPYYVNCDVTVPAGQTLEIRPGVEVLFTGHYKFNVLGNLQAIGTEQDSIVFTRAFPTEESRGWGLRFSHSEGISRLEYCLMQHGKTGNTGQVEEVTGGAIFIDSSVVDIDRCSFKNNTAISKGGAIYIEHGDGGSITNSVFHDNEQTLGTSTDWEVTAGALQITYSDTFLIQNCSFVFNQSAHSGGAIGIVMSGNSCVMNNCEITSNIAYWDGGGIQMTNAEPTISNCSISNNTATRHGGGISCITSLPLIQNCAIDGNSAGQQGGGMRSAGGSIQRCLITNNTAGTNGGGICMVPNNTPHFENCTIYGNSAANQGGGILRANSYNKNLIVWGNFATTCAGMTPSDVGTTYSDIQGGYPDVGNIDTDPMFIDAPNGDFHLQANSPCIDTGDPTSPLDPDGSRADMGAFPYSGPRLRVTSPDGGESWTLLDSSVLQWIGTGFDGTVVIEINRDYPSGDWDTLAFDTPNDSVETVFVEEPISDHCRVRISSLETGFTDVSNADFAIVPSSGYLAMVRSSQPNTALLSWNAGTMECPNAIQETFRLKNFGSASINVFRPEETPTAEFSRVTACPSSFTLLHGQVSSCDLTLSFTPESDGNYLDSMRIRTNASNGTNGALWIPLTGSQTTTPASPNVTIFVQGNDALLRWSPIVESVGQCPITATGYLVFYSPTQAGPFYYHGFTTDTSYTHTRVVQYNFGMYYHVYATIEPLMMLSELPDFDVNRLMTEDDVLGVLRQRGVTFKRVDE